MTTPKYNIGDRVRVARAIMRKKRNVAPPKNSSRFKGREFTIEDVDASDLSYTLSGDRTHSWFIEEWLEPVITASTSGAPVRILKSFDGVKVGSKLRVRPDLKEVRTTASDSWYATDKMCALAGQLVTVSSVDAYKVTVDEVSSASKWPPSFFCEDAPKTPSLSDLKPGMLVKIRSDLKGGEKYGNDIFVSGMRDWSGKVVKIDSINSMKFYIENCTCNWTPEMIECIVTNPTTSQQVTKAACKRYELKVGDRVRLVYGTPDQGEHDGGPCDIEWDTDRRFDGTAVVSHVHRDGDIKLESGRYYRPYWLAKVVDATPTPVPESKMARKQLTEPKTACKRRELKKGDVVSCVLNTPSEGPDDGLTYLSRSGKEFFGTAVVIRIHDDGDVRVRDKWYKPNWLALESKAAIKAATSEPMPQKAPVQTTPRGIKVGDTVWIRPDIKDAAGRRKSIDSLYIADEMIESAGQSISVTGIISSDRFHGTINSTGSNWTWNDNCVVLTEPTPAEMKAVTVTERPVSPESINYYGKILKTGTPIVIKTSKGLTHGAIQLDAAGLKPGDYFALCTNDSNFDGYEVPNKLGYKYSYAIRIGDGETVSFEIADSSTPASTKPQSETPTAMKTYQKGDKVLIRRDLTTDMGIKYGINGDMAALAGKVATIRRQIHTDGYYIDLDRETWTWHPDAFAEDVEVSLIKLGARAFGLAPTPPFEGSLVVDISIPKLIIDESSKTF